MNDVLAKILDSLSKKSELLRPLVPPALTWAELDREKIEHLKKQDENHRFFDSNGEFHACVKQRLGAFWGTVFMGALGYEKKKKVSITGHNAFGLSTASRYEKDGDTSTYLRINIH